MKEGSKIMMMMVLFLVLFQKPTELVLYTLRKVRTNVERKGKISRLGPSCGPCGDSRATGVHPHNV